MDIQVEDYEIAEVLPDEMKHWKKAFKQKCNKKISKRQKI